MKRFNKGAIPLFILISILLATSSIIPGFAQGTEEARIPSIRSFAPTGKNLSFEHLTSDDGLPSNRVLSVLRDNRGFMWFGTFDGLARYDGYEYKIFRHKPGDEHSISANVIVRLYQDLDGFLWVGTSGGGLNRYDPKTEQFTRYQHDPTDLHSLSSDNVMALYQDQDGLLWIGTAGGGLNRYEPESNSFIRFQNDPRDPNSLSNNAVWAILEDESGTLWVGTDGGGLNRFDREMEQFSVYRHDPRNPDSLGDDSVLALSESAEGSLWVGTRSNGLDRFNPDLESFTHYRHVPEDPNSLGGNNIMDLFTDQSGILWIATGNAGLSQFDFQEGRFFRYEPDPHDPSSLSSSFISQVFIDTTGLLWLTTVGGGVNISDLEPKPFTNIQTMIGDSNSLTSNNVTVIYEDQEGGLWLGTSEGGLNRLDRKTMQISRYVHDPNDPDSLSDDYVRSIVEDDEGMLWLGTRNGLNRFDPSTEMFTTIHPNPAKPTGLLSESIWSLHLDSHDTLWIGTSTGLNRFEPSTNRFSDYVHNLDDPRSLSGNNVTVIQEDRNGSLWLGTLGSGLNYLDRESDRFVRYMHDPNDPTSLSSNTVWTIYEDSVGNLWIGTTIGLDRFDPVNGGFKHYSDDNGFPRVGVMNILEDNLPPEQGGPNLWVGTPKGLYRFNPQIESLRKFSIEDGVQGDEFNRNSASKSANGELLFGGINGVTSFYPSQIQDNPHVPPVVITDFQLAHKPVQISEDSILHQSITETDNLKLSYQDRVISFEFAALDFHAPGKNRYRYMMEGFDADWIEVGSDRRVVTYTNLDPGEYVFCVKGSNNDGVWNEDGAEIQITITPPWWGTSWALGIFLVMVIAGLFGGYRWRVRSLESRKNELEAQVQRQTRQLDNRIRELDTLLSVSRNVTSTLELESLLVLVLDQLRKVIDYDVSTIRRLVKGNMELQAHRWLFSEAGQPSQRLPVATIPVLREIVQTQQAILIGDHQFDPAIVGDPDFYKRELTGDVLRASRTLMCVPMLIKNETIGVMILGHHQPNQWDEVKKEIVQAFANQAAVAIINAELFEKARETATLEERNRLARELHDSATQSLYSATLFGEAGKELAERGDMESATYYLSRVGEEVHQALKDMRLLVFQLRPPILEEEDLVGALQKRLDSVENRTGMKAQLISDPLGPLPDGVGDNLYAIAQEALNNVLKHAETDSVTVSIHSKGNILTLEVVDDGRGFDLESEEDSGGMGLKNIRERVSGLNGDLTIESALDKGTSVKVSIPLTESNANTFEQPETSE